MHGICFDSSHTSCTCHNRANGHDEYATYRNKKGGTNTDHTTTSVSYVVSKNNIVDKLNNIEQQQVNLDAKIV